MKIRWRRDSVRFRISPAELTQLMTGAPVEETLGLPGVESGSIGWRAILCVGDTDATTLCMADGALMLRLSRRDVEQLVSADNEGVYFARDDFRYFIEKDFPCAHPRPAAARETSETFVPPPGFKERHRTG